MIREGEQGERSFSMELAGLEKGEEVVVKGYVDEEQMWRFQKCLVCESATVTDARTISERLAKFGLGEIVVKRLQGRLSWWRSRMRS